MDNTVAIPPTLQPAQPAWYRRRWVIISLIAATLLIGGFVAWFLLADHGDRVLQTDRPGYSRQPTIGDPAALQTNSGKQPAKYRGANVVQACGVIRPVELRDAGLHLTAGSLPGTVSRTYFDGQSQAGLPIGSIDIPLVTNECTYRLQDSSGALAQVRVYHPSYVDTDAVMRALDRQSYQPTSLEGLVAYRRPADAARPGDLSYMLQSGDYMADVRIVLTGNDGEAKKQRLMKMAAERLKALAAAPAGVPVFGYTSPVFKGYYANGCDLVTADDFKIFHTTDPSPLVQEEIAGSVGIASYGADSGPKSYNYIAHRCKRTAIDRSIRTSKSITIVTETYETDSPAKAWMAYHQPRAANTTKLEHTIGDMSYFGDNAGLERALTFRKGRAVVQLTFTDASKTEDVATQAERLRPLAEALANRLKEF